MTSGRIEQLHLLLPVAFILPNQPDFMLDFVVDTGFTGYLSLPLRAVDAMQLPYLEDIPATLADDTDVNMAVHLGRIRWNGGERDVRILAGVRRPLLGTALLAGHEMLAQFQDGGTLTLTSL